MMSISAESKVYARLMGQVRSGGRLLIKTTDKAFCDLCIIYSRIHDCFVIFGTKKFFLSKVSRVMLIKLAKNGAITPPSGWQLG